MPTLTRPSRLPTVKRLTNAAAGIKDYVDRHIAHARNPPAVPVSVTLVADLHAAIDVIGDVFQRY